MDTETLEQVKRHFNVATEAMRAEFRTVVEAVAAQGEEFRREFAVVRGKIEEVKAMIRLFYAGLRARLERVEARIGG
jgi:hypothetical protein